MAVATDPSRPSLYQEVTARIIAELEAGRLPWVQPWEASSCACTMPANATTGRVYSGINVLLLWAAVIERGYGTQRWLTFHQAQSVGGSVRRGEKGVTVCYADRFSPSEERKLAVDEARDPRTIAFLKRFTVFNVDQCEGLPDALTQTLAMLPEAAILPRVQTFIERSGASLHIGGDHAFYAPQVDAVVVPSQAAFPEPINWYRTLLHELGHWTGHPQRLARKQDGRFGSADYAREELVAEMASAFTCASLSIQPTVRHSDYIGSWLAVLREDARAIFRVASLASKAADYLLAFVAEHETLGAAA